MSPMTTKSSPPSAEVVTKAQLGRASDRFEARCRKNEAFLSKSVVRRRVTVNRDLTPEQMIEATGCKQYVDTKVLKTMPRKGTGIEEVDVGFFNVGRYLTIDEQEKELATFGFEPDYYAQIQVNIDDPSFADEHPNGAQWDKNGGQASYIAFGCDGDERHVYVDRYGPGWSAGWWFAGVRKVS